MSDKSNNTSRRDALKLVAGTGSALVLGSSATGLAAADSNEYWRNVVADKTSDEIVVNADEDATLQLSLTIYADDDIERDTWLTGVGWGVSIQGDDGSRYDIDDIEVEYLPDQNLESTVEFEDGASQTDREGNQAAQEFREMAIEAIKEIPGAGVATAPIDLSESQIETSNRGSGQAVMFLDDVIYDTKTIGGSANFRYYASGSGDQFNGRIILSATVVREELTGINYVPQETVNESIEVTVPFEPNIENNSTVPEAIDADDDGDIDDSEILDAIEYWQNDEEVPGTGGETIDDQTLLELVERWQNGN